MKKPIYVLLSFAFCFGLLNHANAQEAKTFCSSVDANKRMEDLYPNEVKAAKEQLDIETAEFESERSANAVIYTIPVVFHILHDYGTENISDAQVEDAVAILTRDYNKQNADTANIVSAFQGIAANVGIEFKLARLDPNGNCTNGIDRIYSALTYVGDDDTKLNGWPRNKYLNIWVVKSIASGAAGYSMYPQSVSFGNGAAVDGVMILSTYVGSIGTGSASRSRALTHEVGHWLNLPHPWGNSNTPGSASNCNIDDGVTDTPNTIGWTSCNLNGTSCGSLDNVQNYMDYSYCSNMFTNGQKTRMLAALNSNVSSRSNLKSASNLTATGVNNAGICSPIADFYASTPQVCVNSTINFYDNTNLSQATSWNWTFPGGNPATSAAQNPSVQYSSAGTYSVSLTASNASGNDSITKNSYINVESATANVTASSFMESFETLTINPASNWAINNVTGGNTWAITSTAAYTGSKSMKLNNINNTVGAIDEFITPSFDLTQIANPKLYYKIAYASLTGTGNEPNSLKIYSSTDCGKTWAVRRNYTETSLATVSAQNSSFTPTTPAQWRADNVSLSLFSNYTNIQFKFRFEAGDGNNLYIDDINLDNLTASVNELDELKNNFSLYPNPADDNAVVYYTTSSRANVSLKVIDVLGKIVYSQSSNNVQEGNHTLTLTKDMLPASGVYFIQLMVNDMQVTKKLVVR